MPTGNKLSSIAFLSFAALFVGACSGSDDSKSAETGTNPRISVGPRSLGARLSRTPGPNVSFNFATSDYAIGENRVAFAVTRPNGQLVQAPRARVYMARSLADEPNFVGVAELKPVGPESHPRRAAPHDHAAQTDLYVIRTRLLQAGSYVLLAEPVGEQIQAASEITV